MSRFRNGVAQREEERRHQSAEWRRLEGRLDQDQAFLRAHREKLEDLRAECARNCTLDRLGEY